MISQMFLGLITHDLLPASSAGLVTTELLDSDIGIDYRPSLLLVHSSPRSITAKAAVSGPSVTRALPASSSSHST
eukprot:COSAG06_NODE_1580_length_9031_cov_6.088894_9_plen_75_part_00